jgi:hypothetical protein
MAENRKRKWARVVAIAPNSLCAQTQEGEYVYASRQYGRMAQVRPGDIISFLPEKFDSPSRVDWRGGQIKWFAKNPEIIGKQWHGKPPDQLEFHARRLSHEDIPFEEAFPGAG